MRASAVAVDPALRPNKTRRSLLVMACVLSALPLAVCASGQWCVINDSGNSVSCWGAIDVCQQVAARYGEACVFRQDAPLYSAPAAPSSASSDFNEGYATGQALGKLLFGDPEEKRRKEQAQREQERLAIERQRLEIERQQLAELEAQRRAAEQARLQQETSSRETSGGPIDLASHEKTCRELGFKKGTLAYGECVLELDRRARGP